jgi:subtilisin family serine protease
MNQDYVVLRIPGLKKSAETMSTDDGAVLSSIPADVTPADIQVETLSAPTAKDMQDLHDDPERFAAPEMPIELIAPVILAAGDDDDSVADDAGPIAWGLLATRVDSSTFSGKGITVAVLDTGIDIDHPAFKDKKGVIKQEDFTGEGGGDQHGHGTHCAGTVFGGDVDGVRIGIARNVDKALIGKVFDSSGRGSTKNIMQGILWAVTNGANIISMSLGFDFPSQVKRNVAKGIAIEAATSMALQAYRENVRLFDDLAALVESSASQFSKTIVIAAAGNESKRPTFEIGTAPPAVARGFLSVGALRRAKDNKFRVAKFSNSLPKVAGPGVDIRSARLGGGLTSMNGTSMATPHVAGIAALWMERVIDGNPQFDISEVRGRLTASGSHTGIEKAERANTGAGLVCAPQ